jgi:hypothetical protein
VMAPRAVGRGAGRVGLDDDGVAGRERAVDGHADRQQAEHGSGQQRLGSGEDGPRQMVAAAATIIGCAEKARKSRI